MRTALRHVLLLLMLLPLNWGRTWALGITDSVQAAQLLDSIEILQQTEDLPSTLKFIERTIELYDSLNLTQLRQTAELQRGATLRNMGRHLDALQCFMDLLREEEESGDSLSKAQVLTHIGATYRHKGDYPTALKHYHQALSIYQTLHHNHGKASIYNNIGIIHLHTEHVDKALEFYQKAYELYKTNNNIKGINIVLLNIGEAYCHKHDYTSALKYYDLALEYALQINDLDIIGNIYLEAARLNILEKKLRWVLPSLNLAIDAFKKRDSHSQLTECEVIYGEYYMALNKPQQALSHLNNALSMAKKANLLPMIASITLKISQSYEQMGNTAKALEYHKQHLIIHDSIHNSQHLHSLLEAELSYEFNRKIEMQQREQEQSRMQLEQHREHSRTLRRFGALIAIILLFTIITVLALLHESRKKNTTLLSLMAEVSENNNKLIQSQEHINEQHSDIERKNKIMHRSKRIITEKNHKLINSLEYAHNIQNALLPRPSTLTRVFDDHMLIYRPKDIVSGDFYWISQQNDVLSVAVMDCTGHGVPGAFMSLIGNTLLNQIVNEWNVQSPSQILNHLDTLLRDLLQQHERKTNMSSIDIGILTIDLKEDKATYASANRPLIMIQNGEMSQIKGTPRSAGGLRPNKTIDFESTDIPLCYETFFYMTTDGFTDQMNPQHHKLGWQNFISTLQRNYNRPMIIQQELLTNMLDTHSQQHPQIDDICILGFKMKPRRRNFSA